jgi:hypothetical protein
VYGGATQSGQRRGDGRGDVTGCVAAWGGDHFCVDSEVDGWRQGRECRADDDFACAAGQRWVAPRGIDGMVSVGAEGCEERGCCGRCVVFGSRVVWGAEIRAAKDDCWLFSDGRRLGAHFDGVAR